jgi:hypothetical protein
MAARSIDGCGSATSAPRSTSARSCPNRPGPRLRDQRNSKFFHVNIYECQPQHGWHPPTSPSRTRRLHLHRPGKLDHPDQGRPASAWGEASAGTRSPIPSRRSRRASSPTTACITIDNVSYSYPIIIDRLSRTSPTRRRSSRSTAPTPPPATVCR